MYDIVRTLVCTCHAANLTSCSYLIPPHVTSLRDHPLDERIRDIVADDRAVDRDIVARCRSALSTYRLSPSGQRSDRTPNRSLESPRVKREPSTPILPKHEMLASTKWAQQGRSPIDLLLVQTRDSILNGQPDVSRKRPRDSVESHVNEPLPATIRRLEEERHAAQARETALQAEAMRVADLERSLETYKSCVALTERRDLRLVDVLNMVFGIASTPVDALDELERQYLALDSRTRTASEDTKGARAALDARGAELGFGEGPGLTLPVLLDALQQIAGIASASAR